MGPGRAAALAAYWTLPFLLMIQVSGSGVFELQLQSFSNPKGLNSDGNCCNGFRTVGVCTSPCMTFFRVCLTHYRADISTDLNPMCTFGNYTSKVVAENSVNFTANKDLPMDNPVRFRFEDILWPGDFSLIIEAYHDTTLKGPYSGSQRELISRMALLRSAAAGADWFNSQYVTGNTELKYSYRFLCDEHYYGPACGDLCRPRNDQFGHLYCSPNGTKICLDGWQGEYCDRAICLPGCHPDNGFCDTPNECRCRLGWEGKVCNVCIPYPGCLHGTCVKPYWECTCEEGWGGQFCNQDLNYCTHHTPCANGGTCTNTGEGSYTCACHPGFTGHNCEVKVNHCEKNPCLRGTCKDLGTGYQCSCPQGFYGDECQWEAKYCRAETCFNGGTCVDHDSSYQCRCPMGFEGFHCETDTGGCKINTCVNGGTCINGACLCPTGFSGPTCAIDGDDCAHQPCLNGGTCLDLINHFECRCVAGFVGPNCEINVDECEMRPCANGGSCTDLVNDFKCTCTPGFTAKDCSRNVDECSPQPCQNGGTCLDRVNDYTCRCPEGFWGKDCHLYEGMMSTTPSAVVRVPTPSTGLSTSAPNLAPPTTEDPAHHSSNSSKHGEQSSLEGAESGLSSPQLLVVVCVGGGFPLLLIIVLVVILLCRKHRHLRQNQDMATERQQNYINNMNNRESRDSKFLEEEGGGGGGGGGSASRKSESNKMEGIAAIFTPFPRSVSVPSTSSSMKTCNAEQEDINRLNAQKHRTARDKAGGKNFIRDSFVQESPYSANSFGQRDSQYEKSVKRLDADSLSDDIKVDVGSYQTYSGEVALSASPQTPSPCDSVRTSVYLEPTHSRHSCYAEDYLATTV